MSSSSSSSSNSMPESLDLENKYEGDIDLLTNDNKKYTISKKDASISVLIETMMIDNPDETELNLDITSVVLENIIPYMKYHQGIPPSLIDPTTGLKNPYSKNRIIDKWDLDYITKINESNRQLLYDITLGSNYLDMEHLLHISCQSISNIIKGVPLDQVREKLVKGTKLEGTSPPK
jgi:S-phase kinase-associated protein 1